MQRKIRTNEEIGLEEPVFKSNPGIGSTEVNDVTLGKKTFRIWSVFASEGDPSDRLADLMQTSIESGEEVGEVHDWQMIELGKAILTGRKILENREKGLPDDYGLPLEIKVFDKSEMWKTVDNGV